MSKLIRTSVTDPLRIATVPVGDKGGAVGITFAPGKHQTAAMTGIWQRDLGLDLEAIRQWGASDLITLLEPQEFAELGVSELPKATHEIGMCWHGLPITDGAAPDVRFLKPWAELERQLVGRLKRGQRVVVHCKGGLGRAGTVACMLLLVADVAADADDAMARVRAIRRGAIETVEQEKFLHTWANTHAHSRSGFSLRSI